MFWTRDCIFVAGDLMTGGPAILQAIMLSLVVLVVVLLLAKSRQAQPEFDLEQGVLPSI